MCRTLYFRSPFLFFAEYTCPFWTRCLDYYAYLWYLPSIFILCATTLHVYLSYAYRYVSYRCLYI